MDKKLKDKWVKALMSGKYEQCDGSLFESHSGGYCCLGVLGRVMGMPAEDMNYGNFLHEIEDQYAVLPKLVERKLSDMNDEGIPFPVIAGFIQENL